ncbi:MAG: MerR family transcriptional regulator, partial [Candidatus Cloacimonadota bacterium]|nr:MerR family transcriptional regulator [Candidatus Cloacimonadota bacterium]
MKKSYYTIGEVSNLLKVKAHVLRYWEKEFPQLNPKKNFGRNRRYDKDDIQLL